MINKVFLISILFVCLNTRLCIATAPSHRPHDYMLFSDHGQSCAFISATEKKVIVFRTSSGNMWVDPLYSIDGWYTECYLSDDGLKFIKISSLILPKDVNVVPVVRVWIKGSLVKSLYLKDVLGDSRPLVVSSGEYLWTKGKDRFSGDNGFIIGLINGSTYEIQF